MASQREHQGKIRTLSIAYRVEENEREPIRITVTCEHGVTVRMLRRVCPDGCHHDPLAALTCEFVHPAEEVIHWEGLRAHHKKLACGCGRRYWLQRGPEHLVFGLVDEQPLYCTGYDEDGPIDLVSEYVLDLPSRH